MDGQSIHSDATGSIAELAFRPNATLAPHANPHLIYFVVIEGGGFVQVGDERARVAAGEAVVWPPNVVHAAWTEQTPMRALVVEFAVDDHGVLMLEGGAVEGPEPARPPEQAEGSNAELRTIDRSRSERRPAGGGLVSEPGGRPDDHESPEREPW